MPQHPKNTWLRWLVLTWTKPLQKHWYHVTKTLFLQHFPLNCCSGLFLLGFCSLVFKVKRQWCFRKRQLYCDRKHTSCIWILMVLRAHTAHFDKKRYAWEAERGKLPACSEVVPHWQHTKQGGLQRKPGGTTRVEIVSESITHVVTPKCFRGDHSAESWRRWTLCPACYSSEGYRRLDRISLEWTPHPAGTGLTKSFIFWTVTFKSHIILLSDETASGMKNLLVVLTSHPLWRLVAHSHSSSKASVLLCTQLWPGIRPESVLPVFSWSNEIQI